MLSRGSEWRRWEPHIHAPGTVMNNQFSGPTAWNDYLAALEQATPVIEVKANKVEKGSAFSIAVASRDWSEMITVIKRTSADGIHKGDIKKAVRLAKKPGDWKGPISFNIVVVIEGKGKASYFDWFKIRAEN